MYNQKHIKMDRPISQQVQRKRSFKQFGIIGIIVVALLSGVWALRNTIKTSIPANKIRVAIAESGPLTSTLTANGELIPEFEQVLTSPIRATIEDVLVSVGENVGKDQQVLVLDKAQTNLRYEKLETELAVRQNNMARLKLNLEKDLEDLKVKDSIKYLQIKRLVTERDTEEELLKMGGGVKQDLEKIELNLKIAQLEKEQIENNIRIKNAAIKADLIDEQLQIDLKRQDMKELERKLQLANIAAKSTGVLTWVNDKIGAAINEGEVLARVADLRSFKVVARCSDNYSDQLRTGMQAIVDINDLRLEGIIANIRPTVENNIITFEIQLTENNHMSLRPNMRVDVYVVTASKAQTIKVANGPTFTGRPRQNIFILKGDKAIKREVEIGLSNFDFVEITRNLNAGEQVIISDMSDYDHLPEVQIKN